MKKYLVKNAGFDDEVYILTADEQEAYSLPEAVYLEHPDRMMCISWDGKLCVDNYYKSTSDPRVLEIIQSGDLSQTIPTQYGVITISADSISDRDMLKIKAMSNLNGGDFTFSEHDADVWQKLFIAGLPEDPLGLSHDYKKMFESACAALIGTIRFKYGDYCRARDKGKLTTDAQKAKLNELKLLLDVALQGGVERAFSSEFGAIRDVVDAEYDNLESDSSVYNAYNFFEED